MRRVSAFLLPAVLAVGCTPKPVAVAVEAPPPPVAPPAPAMPAGGVPGMVIPARTLDGGWPTPGRALSADGTVWHLRAALNVAALVCREGGQGEAVVGAYNAMLTGRKAALGAAEQRYAAEWRALDPAEWQDRYDDAMTRAYNFYGQSFARPGFCAAAAQTLTDMAVLPDEQLSAFAAERLPTLDRPFADFFTAYAAWRDGATAQPATAVARVVPAGPVQVSVAVPAAKPWLGIDPAVYRMP
ncbi:hypothetical protein [Sphingomonas rubra]|uniref:Uncharacterized protein n=1 Tax=Sphingomonas rubra TaxID=634430 RepID=A0A1I5T4P7_9SPHN|nr:hypothetical protein [Sphingomonas rubra]SFP77928.1 hypothetical protein SAMN04488241_10741 [Sphingomonas rubra]